jgi:hypothetical protein
MISTHEHNQMYSVIECVGWSIDEASLAQDRLVDFRLLVHFVSSMLISSLLSFLLFICE